MQFRINSGPGLISDCVPVHIARCVFDGCIWAEGNCLVAPPSRCPGSRLQSACKHDDAFGPVTLMQGRSQGMRHIRHLTSAVFLFVFGYDAAMAQPAQQGLTRLRMEPLLLP